MTQAQFDILAIGNAIVDVIAKAEERFLAAESLEKGSMQLIDAVRAHELYERMGPARELSGGSAANTVAGLATLGHRCEFIGQVADDQLGQVFAHDIRASGVEFRTVPKADGQATARSLILVTPDGQRTMNTYLGVSQELNVAALSHDQIASAKALFLEGYLWDPSEPRAAMRQAITAAKSNGRDIILTLSDAWLVERHRGDFSAMLERNEVDVLFANRHEALAFAQTESLDSAIDKLRQKVPLLVITDGPNGACCAKGNEIWQVGADLEVEVVDTTGAGDAFAAGFLAGYIRQYSPELSLKMGTICAAEAISHYGPRPEANLTELLAAKLGHLPS